MRWRLPVLLLPAGLFALLGWTHRWNSDDAFINFRVVDQLLHGAGPVYNAGERVEAYTSPAWVAVLSLGSAVVGSTHVEWVAVGTGLVLSVAAVAAATFAAAALNAPGDGGRAVMLPLGALVFVALPPAWDFATSGLETGLEFAWLGTCFLGLVLVHTRSRWREPGPAGLTALDGVAVLAGIGVLVRPDFAVFSAGFLALAICLAEGPLGRRAIRLVALAATLPLAYELFRLAYFALPVPNTALAKEGFRARWGQGLRYLWDLTGPYWLFLPLAALAWWGASRSVRDRGQAALLRAVPAAAGALHVLYVVRLGGDFMHGRMLLPGLFAALMPVAAIPVRRRPAEIGLAVIVAGWASVCGLALRTGYDGDAHNFPHGIADERAVYIDQSGNTHPVTLYDYRRTELSRAGTAARLLAQRAVPVLTFVGWREVVSAPDVPALGGRVVAPAGSVGQFGYAAGREVHVVDMGGLADPLASRLELDVRARPGHEKFLLPDWAFARFSDPRGRPPQLNTPSVLAAEQALGCGRLRETLTAVHAPESPSRALSNARAAIGLMRWRLPRDPGAARAKLCGRGVGG